MNTITVSLENEITITKEIPQDAEYGAPTWYTLVEGFLEILGNLGYHLPRPPKDCINILEDARYPTGDIYKCKISLPGCGMQDKLIYGDIIPKNGELLFRTSIEEYPLSCCSEFEFVSEGYSKLIGVTHDRLPE